MEVASTNTKKDSQEEENTVQYAFKRVESEEGNTVSKRYPTKLDPKKTLMLRNRRSRTSGNCRELFLQNFHGLHNTIPKQITTFDEKYVLHCLELIRNCALRAAALNFSSKVDFLPVIDVSNTAETGNRDIYNMARLSGNEVVLNSSENTIIGSVSGSQSMINILNSPLLQQFGSLNYNSKFRNIRLLDVSEPVLSDCVGNRQELGTLSSHNLQKEATIFDTKYTSSPFHKRLVSRSSTSSSSSDQSTSTSSSMFHGMLQSSWKDGLLHHVFTVDDKKEYFIANSAKVQSLNGKAFDYVYSFHSTKNRKKEYDMHEHDSESVGQMRVSTLITFCSDNGSEVRETQFILHNDNLTREVQNANQSLKKNRLTRKVVDIFRSNHSRKQSTLPKFGGTGTILEETIPEPSEDVHKNLDLCDAKSDDSYVPNLELAAIIVKETITNHKEDDLGGWGLKFLKKPGNKASQSTENNGECSTSMNVVIPAGLHGGPRTRIGGPSSLIERWTSGGHCDCGGWDIGCPLTILNARSSNDDSSCKADNTEECKSVDLYMEGSRQEVPIMKMVNIHDGLYYIHFQSILSSLQSFAIATAIIHSRNPVLRPKAYRSKK